MRPSAGIDGRARPSENEVFDPKRRLVARHQSYGDLGAGSTSDPRIFSYAATTYEQPCIRLTAAVSMVGNFALALSDRFL